MGKLRYVKSPEELELAAQFNPEFLPSHIKQLRAVYESDAEIISAVLPPPLEAIAGRPEIGITISQVTMHLGPGIDVEIGAGLFGVRASYEGVEGLYLITMPMTTEGAVVGGRETYGEPKKLAEIDFKKDGNQVEASITRQGIPYIQLRGTIGASAGNDEFTEYAYCFKCLPSLDKSKAFEFDPLLVRLEWQHKMEQLNSFDGEIILNESPFDPVADIPVRKIVSIRYEEGGTTSSGQVLRSVPGEWIVPYLHQRYDDTAGMLAEFAQQAEAQQA